jgi:hypothetical protein
MGKKSFFIVLIILALTLALASCTDKNKDDRGTLDDSKHDSVTVDEEKNDDQIILEKPVIYLYPEEKTDVRVTLDYNGKLFVTYPGYKDGWNVTAYPDGTIINKADNKEYSYLFWEGNSTIMYDFTTGFIVSGKDTEQFLQEKLKFMGLTPREYNEFIVYWLPKMIDNPYNLISFQHETYTNNAVLEITPPPDSMQRIFMAFKPLKHKIDIPEQNLEPFLKEGFAVIEWGGSEVTD